MERKLDTVQPCCYDVKFQTDYMKLQVKGQHLNQFGAAVNADPEQLEFFFVLIGCRNGCELSMNIYPTGCFLNVRCN